jgi:methionyl-tRNA formyltransferase
MRIVVLAKDRPGLTEAVSFLRQHTCHVDVAVGQRADPFPCQLFESPPDVLVSYLSAWIVPADVLALVKGVAVNFHPGPPDYPGSGCTNFALYHGVSRFGVTAHRMLPGVDSGPIFHVARFDVSPDETVLSLTNKCYSEIQRIFPLVMSRLFAGELQVDTGENWTRKPYTRRELDALCRISPEMSEDEVRRRIRATVFPGAPGPFVEFFGSRFEYVSK